MRGFVATDFDGTLAGKDGIVSPVNINTLKQLGNSGILRAIVTGRSLFSLLGAFTEIEQVDYIVFSSGAGIYDVSKGKVVREKNLTARQVEKISAFLTGLECDYMLHHPVPDSHRFAYFRNALQENDDFLKRRKHYKGHDIAPEEAVFIKTGACQFLVIDKQGGDLHSIISRDLADFTIIRTTSPLNSDYTWIEIFPAEVDKGTAVEWIAHKHNFTRAQVFAIGNDFNDQHMLEWAGTSAVVENGPEELRAVFTTVPSNVKDGFTIAVNAWLEGSLQ